MSAHIALIKGDGIGAAVCNATTYLVDFCLRLVGKTPLNITKIDAGDAIFLGAIGLPSIRYKNGTEISTHLRLREQFQLYAGVRPVKAYPNIPQKLADPRAANINFIVIRESTEGLFHSAAVHNRSHIKTDFTVDKISAYYPDVAKFYNYVDAQAVDLIRQPLDANILVMENMFGDVLSDLAGGLVDGMGMAACAEIGDNIGLFQPAHGSAPDIMGQDRANPLAAILSGVLMLDYPADKLDLWRYAGDSRLLDTAITTAFETNTIRPIEFGGNMGTVAVTRAIAESCHPIQTSL